MRALGLIARLTFHESIRNRWVTIFSAAFAILAFLLAFAGSGETRALSGFDRSAAMLLNILLLFVPLLGLTLGAQLISSDRENGSLIYLMSQPVKKSQIFFGKALGALFAMTTSISGGFAVAGLAISVGGGGQVGSFIVLWILSLIFVLVCVSIGLLISVLSSNRSRATGAAMSAWLAFTVLSDLGLMGTAYVLRLRSEGIVGMALLNPVESFKILAVRLLATQLESLGAGGMYLDYLLGSWLPFALSLWLLVIAAVGLGLSYGLFVSQEEA